MPPPEGTVVVGVDGSEESLVALRFGLAEARLRGARLVVVNAWTLPNVRVMPAPGLAMPSTLDELAPQLEDHAEAVLHGALAGEAELAEAASVTASAEPRHASL